VCNHRLDGPGVWESRTITTTYAKPLWRQNHDQAWFEDYPQTRASLRDLAPGLFRLKNAGSIKDTTEWVCRDRLRSLELMTT
jgi:hypothetical protein